MKYKRIDLDRAKAIEKQTFGAIEFKILDSSIKGLKIQTSVGPIFVELESYQINVSEIATKETFYLCWQAKIADGIHLIEKYFDSEFEREQYIQQYLLDTPRDELNLETKTVQDI